MAKKNNKLMEYNKACAAAGLTYAQMQQKESTELPQGFGMAAVGQWEETCLLCERWKERMLQGRIPPERVPEEEMRKL